MAVALRLSAWLPGTCSQGSSWDCRQEPAHGALCSISLHEGLEPYTSNRAQAGHRVSASQKTILYPGGFGSQATLALPWVPPSVLLQKEPGTVISARRPHGPGATCPDAKSLFTSMWKSQEIVIGFHFMFPKEPLRMFLRCILY